MNAKEFYKLWNIESNPICRDLRKIKKHRKKYSLNQDTEFPEGCEECKGRFLRTFPY